MTAEIHAGTRWLLAAGLLSWSLSILAACLFGCPGHLLALGVIATYSLLGAGFSIWGASVSGMARVRPAQTPNPARIRRG